MCVVSMVIDHYRDRFSEEPWWKTTPGTYPTPLPDLLPPNPVLPSPFFTKPLAPIGRDEFDQLKRDIEEMKKLLIRAKEYDRKNNEPDCEMAEKAAFIKKIADFVGVDLKDVLGTTKEA